MCYLPISQDDFHLFLHPGHTTPVYIYYSSLGLSFYCILAWCVITWHIQLTFSHCHSITLCAPMHYHMHYIECLRLGFKPCSSLNYYFILPWIIHIFNIYMFIIPYHLPLIYAWMSQHSIQLYYGCYTYISHIWILYYTGHTVWPPLYHILNYFPWFLKHCFNLNYTLITCLFMITVDPWYVISFINGDT